MLFWKPPKTTGLGSMSSCSLSCWLHPPSPCLWHWRPATPFCQVNGTPPTPPALTCSGAHILLGAPLPLLPDSQSLVPTCLQKQPPEPPVPGLSSYTVQKHHPQHNLHKWCPLSCTLGGLSQIPGEKSLTPLQNLSSSHIKDSGT